MKKILVVFLTCFLLLLSSACAQKKTKERKGNRLGEKHISQKEKIPYLVSTPMNYDKDKNAGYPTIMFLHGGDRSNRKHHPKKYAKRAEIDFPFIVIAPNCKGSCSWQTADLKSLIDEVGKTYKLDRSRVYITGYSMGGYGTWSAISRFPDLFAAAAPIAGGGDEKTVCKASTIPIRTYHGDKDAAVSHSESVKLVDALEKCDGNVELITIKGGEHAIWPAIFKDPKFYKWLLKHKKLD